MQAERSPSGPTRRSGVSSNAASYPPPSPPPAVLDLLRRGITERRLLFPENGPVRETVRWDAPSVATEEELALAASYLASLEDAVAPADRGGLLARVLALLSHYRIDPHPPQVELRIADDWAEDLGRYPMWAVDEAARTWRRSRRFKPQISEMIALCDEAVGTCLVERDRLRSIMERARVDANPLARRNACVVRELVRKVATRHTSEIDGY